jgi:hypothetical protein
MAQFTRIGSVDGNQGPVIRRFPINASAQLTVGDAVSITASHGIAVSTAGAGHGILGVVQGFEYGDGTPVALTTAGTVANSTVTAPALNDAVADNNLYASAGVKKMYALVDVNPNSLYSCSVTSGSLAITAGEAGTGCPAYANLGTATTGAQVLSNTLTGSTIGQFLIMNPNPNNVSLSVGPTGGTSLPEVVVKITQSNLMGVST